MLIVIPAFALRILIFRDVPRHTAINISYFFTGLLVSLPLIIILFRTGAKKFNYVLGAVIPFVIALLFRQLDANEISFLPMGTHFLWHAFSALGAYYILAYLYFIREIDVKFK